MKFSFCLEMLYTELSFIDRLDTANKDGIEYFEFWDWRDKDLVTLIKQKDKLKMKVSNISGNRKYGMVDPGDRTYFLNEITEATRIANELNCPRIMLLVQTLTTDGTAGPVPENLSELQLTDQLIDCGLAIVALADAFNIDIVIEPLNSILDHPGYFLDSSNLAFQIIKQINHPRIKVLYDIYHMAVMGEDVMHDIEDNIDLIGYFHVADKPGRKEPGSGEIDYRTIFSILKTLHYSGTVGFECYASDNDSYKAVQNIFSLVS